MPTSALSSALLTGYPWFNLCKLVRFQNDCVADFFEDPNVYPYLDIYPTPYGAVISTVEKASTQEFSLSPALPASYPSFNLCMSFILFRHLKPSALNQILDLSLYPDLDIYPAPYGGVGTTFVKEEHTWESSLSPTLPPMYPSFNLCAYFSYKQILVKAHH